MLLLAVVGFTILLNGESIPYEKTLDSLICFTIEEAGEYTLEFVYRPKVLVLGVAISCASVALFLFLCIFEKRFRAFAWGKGGRTIGVNDNGETLDYDPSCWNYGFLIDDAPDLTTTPETTTDTEEINTDATECSDEAEDILPNNTAASDTETPEDSGALNG